jgi:HK97 family phage portal protein
MGLLSRLFAGPVETRATPENPSFALNDPAAWDAFDGGSKASSGERVNPDRALSFSPWWRGVSLLSQDVGKLPLVLHRVNGTARQPDKAHPAYQLLRWQPNPVQTDLQFKQLLTADSLQHGNGYAYIWRSRSGEPLELLPLEPQAVTPIRVDGQTWYIYRRDNTSEPRRLAPSDVIHIMGLSVDGLAGLPVWEYAKEALGLGIGGKRFQAKRLAGGARPTVVLETPLKIPPDKVKALRDGWERMHSGIDNAHRTAILDNQLTAKTLSFSAADMQEIEQLHLTAADVANFLGLPVHKVDPLAPGRTAYASLEQENYSYLSDGLDYRLCVWERQCRMKLLSERERLSESHAVEFDRSRAVFPDLKTVAEYNRIATGGRPWKTPNEARADLGLAPSAEPDANKLLDPLNMGRGGAANDPKDKAGAKPGGQES